MEIHTGHVWSSLHKSDISLAEFRSSSPLRSRTASRFASKTWLSVTARPSALSLSCNDGASYGGKARSCAIVTKNQAGCLRNRRVRPAEVSAHCSCQFLGSADRARLHWLERTSVEHSGMKMQNLNRIHLRNLPFPVPPLAEQKRIVAKVDELMALCDRLEAQQQERETRHAALARASLARFADAPTPANLDFLFHNVLHHPPRRPPQIHPHPRRPRQTRPPRPQRRTGGRVTGNADEAGCQRHWASEKIPARPYLHTRRDSVRTTLWMGVGTPWKHRRDKHRPDVFASGCFR